MMFAETDKCFPKGTFSLGDTIYSFSKRMVYDKIKNNCPICDNYRKIKIKDTWFTCPQCNGDSNIIRRKEVAEVCKAGKIKTVMLITVQYSKDNIVEYERYSTDVDGIGLQIIKTPEVIYSTDKELLEKMAEEYRKSGK